MKIESVEYFTKEELVTRLRKITMLLDPSNYIYENVFISLEKINTDYLTPPQNYVLNYELVQKRELKYALKEQGCDMFNLNGFVEFCVEGEDIKRTLLPPVVEESIENDGSIMHIINDGMHRIYLARIERLNPEVIFIRGVPKESPYYAYPIAGGWDGVERVDRLSEGYIKKWHRIKNNKMLYRNFDSVFSDCSKPRGYDK